VTDGKGGVSKLRVSRSKCLPYPPTLPNKSSLRHCYSILHLHVTNLFVSNLSIGCTCRRYVTSEQVGLLQLHYNRQTYSDWNEIVGASRKTATSERLSLTVVFYCQEVSFKKVSFKKKDSFKKFSF